ncbi:helix-turn-helix domain-containing protein [Nocardia jiangsuensis]|uniref:Transposase family protein n=1 Tax=Nocardia jiangsuensis TaxID=1691563 RepID=A0ABV8DMT0_9NOCA
MWREGADRPLRGRPRTLVFEDRVLPVACYWRTNLTMRRLSAVFGISKSAAARVIDDLGPASPGGTALIADGTPVRPVTIASPRRRRTR